jgi:hypothetical protein
VFIGYAKNARHRKQSQLKSTKQKRESCQTIKQLVGRIQMINPRSKKENAVASRTRELVKLVPLIMKRLRKKGRAKAKAKERAKEKVQVKGRVKGWAKE